MFIFGKTWQGGYLDYSRNDDQLRIEVRAWMVVAPVDQVYFVRPKRLRLVWESVREVGIRSVIAKIRSRLQESLRNHRFFCYGVGRITPDSATEDWPAGTPVLFLAPCHPKCVERIVLRPQLVRTVDPNLMARLEQPDSVVWLEYHLPELYDDELSGWHDQSGRTIDEARIDELLSASQQVWESASMSAAQRLPLNRTTPVTERSQSRPNQNGALRAVLFGLGNEAKILIVNNLHRRMSLACVHEIDPTQLGPTQHHHSCTDTSPVFRDDEQYDVCFIAGYHHTHADLAIEAIQRGMYAVVEKPVVTSRDQLNRLIAVVESHPGRLFCCFQMRYNPLFELARQDLGVSPGQAIHCYATVFAVRLPKRHWYLWPNSCSHVVRNACHWLDHFLFMNDYSPVVRRDIWKSGNGDSQLCVELENGAVFGMHLTHEGSERIGLSDHIELRANGRTVTVNTGSKYVAEDPHRIIRRKRMYRTTTYHHMYRAINHKLLAGDDGDSLKSVIETNRLMLDLEDIRSGRLPGSAPVPISDNAGNQ